MATGILSTRIVTEKDVNLLSELAAATFRETYALYNTPEDMHAYIRDHFHVDILLKELQDENIKFFFACYDDEIAGYCMLDKTRKVEELNGVDAIEISRIYVRHIFKGKKIGKLLMDKCIEYAQGNNFKGVWLGVWKKNENAVAFYRHCGFVIIGTTKFILGDDVQDDFLMLKKL